MRSLISLSGFAFCALVVSACATDDPVVEQTDPAAVSAAAAQVIAIPPELSLDKLEGTIEGNGFTGTTNACHVTLLFCRDPRFSPPIPSFCQNGGCSTSQALSAAVSLCRSICGATACDVIAQFPNSSGC